VNALHNMTAAATLHRTLVEVFERERVEPPADRSDLVRLLRAASRLARGTPAELPLHHLAEDVLWAGRDLPRSKFAPGFRTKEPAEVLETVRCLLPIVPPAARPDVAQVVARMRDSM